MTAAPRAPSPARLAAAQRGLFAVLASAGLAACGGDDRGVTTPRPPAPVPLPPQPDPPPPGASVFGRIVVDAGEPDAAVSLFGGENGAAVATATLDGEGGFRFAGLDPGTYRLAVTTWRYLPDGEGASLEREVEIGAAEDGGFVYDPAQEFQFHLRRKPGLAVTGRVLDRAGRPVAGATVRAIEIRLNHEVRRTTSTPEGRFGFTGLYGDRYRIEAESADHLPGNPIFLTRPGQGAFLYAADLTLGAATSEADAQFDRVLWNQLVFGTFDQGGGSDTCGVNCVRQPGPDDVLYVLPSPSPNVHFVTGEEDGEQLFEPEFLAEMMEDAPRSIAAITGTPFAGQVTEGPEARTEAGWINVESILPDEESSFCGAAFVGRVIGSIWLNRAERDGERRCHRLDVFRHEVGHAMGFHHPDWRDFPDAVMGYTSADDFSPAERHHMQRAYGFARYTPYFLGPQAPRPGAAPGARPASSGALDEPDRVYCPDPPPR